MMSSLRPSSESFLTVATTVPMTRASCISLRYIHRIDHAYNRRIHGRVLHALRQARARAGDHQHALMKACADCIDGNDIAGRVRAVDVDGADDEQFLSFQPLVLLRRYDRAQNARDDHALDCALIGIASSTLPCGRGITWTLTNSPTRRAAAAPASVAAFTAATSPRTMAVTNPAPIFSYPTRVTFAALTIASAASIIATRPLVSTIPSASCIHFLLKLSTVLENLNRDWIRPARCKALRAC